ncbi:hypothetical protein QAD02_007679 [Eretmocerus hayati]|uniref:Uncharacterized protein n=1 Tax=Eretmocerus hayati TaxID=131215 RepID=A0ACC2N4C8_9HYME|nr:hypothetical protein QAD02_007679 [Eretmocerus hayati]
MSFSCEWNSRSKEEHYVRKVCPPRQQMIPGQKNVQASPLVDRDKIVSPPLYIESGIVKNFFKAMNKTGAGVLFLREKFPRLSKAKLKEEVLFGPDIRKLMLDSGFDAVLNEVELKTWKAGVPEKYIDSSSPLEDFVDPINQIPIDPVHHYYSGIAKNTLNFSYRLLKALVVMS